MTTNNNYVIFRLSRVTKLWVTAAIVEDALAAVDAMSDEVWTQFQTQLFLWLHFDSRIVTANSAANLDLFQFQIQFNSLTDCNPAFIFLGDEMNFQSRLMITFTFEDGDENSTLSNCHVEPLFSKFQFYPNFASHDFVFQS